MLKTTTKISNLPKQNLNRYAGEWVAFVGEKIIEHNKTLKDLMKKIETEGLTEKVSVFLVPRKDEGPYVLIVL